MATNIKAVIFDFGGVLIDWDPRNLYSPYFSSDSGAMERFLEEVDFLEWNSHQDKGCSFAEAVADLSSRFPQYSHLIQVFHDHWEESLVGEVPGSVAILRALKKRGYPLYGLSNWSAETFPKTRVKYSFFDLFEDVVLSGEVKLIKPDPAIFELLLERTGKSADECLLIDDSDQNIAVAPELEFQTIHFKSAPLVKEELHQLNILP